jgi:PAS domain S-box-containing protein
MKNFTRHSITVAILLLVVAYVVYNEVGVRQNARARIELHAEIISNPLWNLNQEEPKAYLAQAIQNDFYERLIITTDNSTVFFSGNGQPLNTVLDRFLARARLIPPLSLSANVIHEGKVIGRIEATARTKAIYNDFYALIMGILLLLVVRFSRKLEGKVRERTAELKNSEERYRQLVDTMHDIVYSVSADGDVLFIGPQVRRYGYTVEELISKPFQDVILPEDRDGVFRAFLRTLATGEETEVVFRVVAKGGRAVWFESLALPVRAADGNIVSLSGMLRDITERMQSETALQESETRYRMLFASARDAILILEHDRFVDCNLAAVEMFRGNREQIVGTTPDKLSPPTQPDGIPSSSKALEKIRAAVQEGPQFFEWRHSRFTGETFDAEVSLNRFSAGGKTYLLAAVRDVTEQKKARKIERDAAQHWNDTFNAVSDAIFILDTEQRILQLNRAAETMLMVGNRQVKGQHCHELVHCLKEPHLNCPVTRLRQTMHRETTEMLVGDRWLNIAVDPILTSDGRLAGIVHSVQDITERKRAVEALRKSEEKFAKAFQESPIVIIISSLRDGQLIEVNESFEKVVGYTRKESLGHTTAELGIWVNPAERERVVAIVSTTGWMRNEEILFRSKSGDVKTCLCSCELIELDGGQCMLSAVEDITERKQMETARAQLEEQLRASQKMEAIGRLASGVAHDFNNLISVILSYTGFAMEGASDGNQLKEDLLEVTKAADRAAALTRQLLAFSRKQVLQPVVLDVNQVVLGVEKMLRRIVGEDIEFVQKLAPDLGLTLADPGQIEQVLLNLVVNARDAMPKGGTLTIETSNVEVDEECAFVHGNAKPGSYVQMVVSDTGCGMDEQTQGRIFEPFFTTKEQGKGTGLGLSTVYGIVTQSGGSIGVCSELGKGTTFKICLPRDRAVATMVVRPVTVSERTKGTETILVVDDEEALRDVAKRSLEAADYRVLMASDGDQALLVSEQHAGDIHLLMTDVIMPRMSGRELAQALLKKRPAIKVLYMSGYTDDAISHHGVLDAGVHFLPKPFTSNDLIQKVRKVLDIGETNLADGQDHEAGNAAKAKGSNRDEQ